MVLAGIGVIGVMVGIHEHRELVLLGTSGIKDDISVFVVDGVLRITIVE